MADAPTSTPTGTAKTFAWTATRALIFLVVLSRGYQMLIALEVVPDFPDPVLKTLSRIYSSFDAIIAEGLGKWGNVALGNIVFGVITRVCSMPARETVKAKGGEKKVVKSVKSGKWKPIRDEGEEEGDIDVTVGTKPGSMMKRNVFIWARCTQCVGFLVKCWEEGKKGEVVVRGVDLAITLVLVGLELKGVQWDGGVVAKVVALVRGPKVEQAIEEKKDGEVDGVKLKLR